MNPMIETAQKLANEENLSQVIYREGLSYFITDFDNFLKLGILDPSLSLIEIVTPEEKNEEQV